MSKPKVDLYVGHGLQPNGRFDPGAVSKDGKWTEQKAGDIVVLEAAQILGPHVDLAHEAFKEDDNFVGSVAGSNERDADVVVAVHHDWNQAPRGGFGFWYPGSEGGKALADSILRAYKRHGLPVRHPWHKARNLYVTRETRMTAVLWECGRIGEFNEEELKQVGQAIAEGIAEHLNLTLYNAEDKDPATTSGNQVTTAKEAFDEIARIVDYDYGTHVNEGDAKAVVSKVRQLAS